MTLKNMNLKYLIILFFIIGCKTHDENKKLPKNSIEYQKIQAVSPQFEGDYEGNVENDETTTGAATISYNFEIKGAYAVLLTNTYHEPIRCNGNYKIFEHKNIIEFYYDGTEKNCKTKEPNFKLKKENKRFFMKGLGGEGTINEWIEIKKAK